MPDGRNEIEIGRFQGLKMRWSGGRDSNSRSPGPKPEAKAYRIRLDLSATSKFSRKSPNSFDDAHGQPGREVISGRSSCAETDNHCQRAIDLTKLTKREQPVGFAKPAWIDCPELLDQDPSQQTVDFYLGSE